LTIVLSLQPDGCTQFRCRCSVAAVDRAGHGHGSTSASVSIVSRSWRTASRCRPIGSPAG